MEKIQFGAKEFDFLVEIGQRPTQSIMD